MINAIKYKKELEEAGFSAEEAEASIHVLFEVMNQEFATKSDLQSFKLELQAGIERLEHQMGRRFAEVEHQMDLRFAGVTSKFQEVDSKLIDLENRLTIRLGTMQAASVALIVALLKLL